MKKLIWGLGIVAAISSMFFIFAADHIDAPAVTGTKSDITDLYVFESPSNPDNLVFVCNTQGLLSPNDTKYADFSSNSLIEFNIDNDGDFVEDLVIQAIFLGNFFGVIGPEPPSQTGTISKIEKSKNVVIGRITPYWSYFPRVSEWRGIKAFAGPRDDPFFFDFTQFNAVISGEATGFNDPGMDTFAGTNVLSLVVEVPKKYLKGSNINTWVETKVKR